MLTLRMIAAPSAKGHSTALPPSIAVLPFADLSPDHGQEFMSDIDGAFDALHRAVRGRQVLVRYLAKVNPALRPLHGDPRWKEFLEAMNLPVE